KMDTTSIIRALLHVRFEDTLVTNEDLVREFGLEVATLVGGVTKITNYRLKGSKKEQFVENLRKMLLVMSKDLRVVFIKLADRLHNMRTMDALPVEKQIQNSMETLEVYAPLAERLGVGKLKGELEDLSFPYAYPEEYKKTRALVEDYFKRGGVEESIETMRKTILSKLIKQKIKADVHGRKKHFYSLWRKLTRPENDWEIEKINDLIALRVLVPEISDCYVALGIIHNTYKPVPSIGVSDYIAQPKPNGYRSIHTKVFGPKGRIVEFQIRTFQMHAEAEFGLAAHWSYKEEVQAGNKLSWVKQLVGWQHEIADTEEFLKAVKFDTLKHRNFIFTPMGDVYDLPVGATPVDFAFAVHTGLGKRIQGAKVDGRIVSLDYKLKSGQVCEILTSKNPKKPNIDWLEFVVTNLARGEINKQLRASS
ncbi:MAG: RelA/SpoT family protein, partial [Patescibacteria group bacterium]